MIGIVPWFGMLGRSHWLGKSPNLLEAPGYAKPYTGQ